MYIACHNTYISGTDLKSIVHYKAQLMNRPEVKNLHNVFVFFACLLVNNNDNRISIYKKFQFDSKLFNFGSSLVYNSSSILFYDISDFIIVASSSWWGFSHSQTGINCTSGMW